MRGLENGLRKDPLEKPLAAWLLLPVNRVRFLQVSTG